MGNYNHEGHEEHEEDIKKAGLSRTHLKSTNNLM